MIAYLRGTVLQKNPVALKGNAFILEVNGVGYRIQATATLVQSMTLHAPATVYTHHVVREDAQALYGFATLAEADFFRLLLSVAGVGPKSALQILDTTKLDDLRQAVASDRPELLVTAAGMSQRLAEKVVLGLQGKLKELLKGTTAGAVTGNVEVVEALIQLGFAPAAARIVVNQVAAQGKSSDQMIREALKLLGQQPAPRSTG